MYPRASSPLIDRHGLRNIWAVPTKAGEDPRGEERPTVPMISFTDIESLRVAASPPNCDADGPILPMLSSQMYSTFMT